MTYTGSCIAIPLPGMPGEGRESWFTVLACAS